MPASSYLDENGRIIAPTIGRAGAEPFAAPLPTPGEIGEENAAEVLARLRAFGLVVSTADEYRATLRLVDRLARLTPGSPAWDRAEERLLDQIGAAAVEDARRLVERYTTAEAVKDDPENQLLIRVSEGDSATCEICDALAGAVGTLAEHEAIGMPGAASCDGGDRCRCVLVPIEGR